MAVRKKFEKKKCLCQQTSLRQLNTLTFIIASRTFHIICPLILFQRDPKMIGSGGIRTHASEETGALRRSAANNWQISTSCLYLVEKLLNSCRYFHNISYLNTYCCYTPTKL